MTALYEEKTICGKTDKWLEASKIQTSFLPKNFHCYGSLSCDGSSLTELPEGLIVEGNLYIGECEIAVLPPKLIIGKDLILLNSSIFDIPNDICICGDIIALKVNNMPFYQSNTDYYNFVCDTKEHPIPYIYSKFIDRYEEKQIFNNSVLFYLGVFNHQCAIQLINNNKNIYPCENLDQGCDFIDRLQLYKSPFYKKYINYNTNEKRFVKELIIILKEVSNISELDIKDFFNDSDILSINKYSIKELCQTLETWAHKNNKPILSHIQLFKDYFFNREIFSSLDLY